LKKKKKKKKKKGKLIFLNKLNKYKKDLFKKKKIYMYIHIIKIDIDYLLNNKEP